MQLGGALVYFSILFFDKTLKIDDPVGAISAHGIVGIWVSWLCHYQLMHHLYHSLVGVISIAGFTFIASLVTISGYK